MGYEVDDDPVNTNLSEGELARNDLGGNGLWDEGEWACDDDTTGAGLWGEGELTGDELDPVNLWNEDEIVW